MAFGFTPLDELPVSILDNVVGVSGIRNLIGSIIVDTTIEELYEDTLEVTEHPVQAGAQITDHSFKRPMDVILRCGWSDSSINALLGGAVANSQEWTGGQTAASDYVAGIYSQLLALQESRQTLSLLTGLRLYTSMLIIGLHVRRDQRTKYALMVEAQFRQVILVDTQTATLPPQANQATPASTAQVVDAGAQGLTAGASPTPSGSLPPANWTGSNPFTVHVGK